MTPITVASYNIHRGMGLDRRRDLDRIAVVIAEMNPDVIGLQEVIRQDGNMMPRRIRRRTWRASSGWSS